MLAWALWALSMLAILVVAWLDHLLRQAGRPDLTQLTRSALPVFAFVSAATVGVVLASRRPHHPIGWLLLAFGMFVIAAGVAAGYASYGLLARPGALPTADNVALVTPAVVLAALACLGFVLLLTPTGSLPSPRWRWWARATAAAPGAFLLAMALAPKPSDPWYQAVDNPLDVHAFTGARLAATQVASAVTILAVVVDAGSLVVRFRRARGTERQQLRWVALGAGLVSAVAVVFLVAVAMQRPALSGGTAAVCLAILPVAVGAAILRYRLYDLDRIISRTLAYGLLTVLLGGGYAGLVLGFGQLLGSNSPLVVAGATLAAAAAFQPARRRVQQAVDRRFNRRRHDAAQTIAAFSARLRQQVDLDTLTVELLAVVEQTMQPTRVSLWLRPPSPAPNGSADAAADGAASQRSR